MATPSPEPHGTDVVLLTARFGEGHRQVARAVAAAVAARAPEVLVETWDFADVLHPLAYRAIEAAYAFSLRHWRAGFAWFYRATAGLVPGTWTHRRLHALGHGRLHALLARRGPRVAVCTFPSEVGMLSELRRKGLWRGVTVVVVTDYAVHSQWVHPHADVYCVPAAEVADGLRLLGLPPDRLRVTGMPLRPEFARPPDRRAARETLGLDPGGRYVLILPGAFGDLRAPVEACRVALARPRTEVLFVAGSTLGAERVRRLFGGDPRVRVWGRVETMATFMRAADALVTKAGGVTASEALRCELPLVLYRPLPGQEGANARFLERRGAAWVAHEPAGLAQALGRVLDDPVQAEAMRAACRRLARAEAAAHVAEVVLHALRSPHGRPAARAFASPRTPR